MPLDAGAEYVFNDAMGKLEKIVMVVAMAAVLVAQSDRPPDVTTVAAAGSVTKFGYTNSYFKLSILAPSATVNLNPLVNASGSRARLVQVLSDGKNWNETYTFAVLADALANYHPPLESTAIYVRSIRHNLEREGLSTVKEEFPVTNCRDPVYRSHTAGTNARRTEIFPGNVFNIPQRLCAFVRRGRRFRSQTHRNARAYGRVSQTLTLQKIYLRLAIKACACSIIFWACSALTPLGSFCRNACKAAIASGNCFIERSACARSR